MKRAVFVLVEVYDDDYVGIDVIEREGLINRPITQWPNGETSPATPFSLWAAESLDVVELTLR